MTISFQVIYPITDTTKFDYDYYFGTHMKIVHEHFGAHLKDTLVTKGEAGGPDTPPGIYAIATLMFEDQAALDAAMAKGGPVIADIPNFTDSQPQMLIGQVMG